MTNAASIGTLVVAIVANASQYRKVMKSIESTTEGTMYQVAKTIKYAGAAIATTMGIIGAAAVREAARFESSFAGVRKTVNATEAEFRALEKSFRAMALQIPVNVNEINKIGEAAGQLGIKTKNLVTFTRTMADLGVATNMTSDQAATSLARLANITQMSQENFGNLGSTIVALGNNLATTESEITEMALRIAGAGTQVGLSEDQILSFAGALSSVGVAADAGGSAISRTMMKIANATASGGLELEKFASVAGMTAADFKTQFETDAAGAIITFIEGLNRMSTSGQNVFAVLEQLGMSDIRMTDALLRAAGAGNLFRQSLEIGNRAWKENTALTKEAEQRYATFESQMTLLKNSLQDILITIGDGLIPVLQVLNGLIKDAQSDTGNFADTAQLLADIFKTSLIVAISVVADAFQGWRVILKGGQLAFAYMIQGAIVGARELVEAMEWMVRQVVDKINVMIRAFNVVAGKVKESLKIQEIAFDKFDLGDELRNWAEGASMSVDQITDELDALLAQGKPSEELMKRLEKAQADYAAKGAEPAAKATAEVTKEIENLGNTVTSISPELFEFQQQLKGPWADALEQLEKYRRLAGQVSQEQLDRATRDTLSKVSPFVAPVAGMMNPTGDSTVDQMGGLMNEQKVLEDQFAREREIIMENTMITEEMRLEMEQAYAAKRDALRRAQLDLLMSSNEQAFGEMANSMREAFGEQSGIYKAMFAASKAFAIADATIKIFQGIANAASLPWPANLAAMASTIAATASLVSNISAVTMSFEGGGYTPDGARAGGVDGKGGFMAVMHPNERVIDLEKDDDIQSQAGGSLSVVINQTFTGGVTEADLDKRAKTIKAETLSAVVEGVSRGGSFRRGVQQ